MMQPPLELGDFSGGETDTPLSAPVNQAEALVNLLVTQNKKLANRPGSEILDGECPSLATSDRLSELIHFKDVLFGTHTRSLTFSDEGAATDVVGPSGNHCFSKGEDETLSDSAKWNNHLVLTNDAFSAVQKVFKGMGLVQAMELANDLKAKFNAHIANTSEHTAGADAAHVVGAANATTLPTLLSLTAELLSEYDAHEADAELNVGFAYHAAHEVSDHSLTSAAAPLNLTEAFARLIDLKAKFNAHDADDTAHGTHSAHQTTKEAPEEAFRVRTGGLPAITAPTVTVGGAGSNNYIYGFVYYYQYSVGEVLFDDFSATVQVELSSSAAPNSSSVSITNIPVIANGSTGNYDTSRIKIKIYRTVTDQTTLYYVGEVTNGTTVYSDSTSDATLENSTTLYTTGGYPDNDPPPPAKYVNIVNGIALYGHVEEGGAVYPNRIRQASPGDVDSCPASFYRDMDSEVRGIGVFDGRHYVVCESQVYRATNYFDATGKGSLDFEVVSEDKGGVSHKSIVTLPEGIAWASEDGFYFTNGQSAMRVSELKNLSYTALVEDDAQARRIYGAYDKKYRRVWWAVEADASGDNDTCWIWDTRFGIKPEGTFTRASGGDSFSPSCLLFLNNELIRGDSRGYVFRHDEELYSDPTVDEVTEAALWNTQSIDYRLKTVALDFGTVAIRKFVPQITLTCQAVTNLTAQISSYNDNSTVSLDLKEVRYRGAPAWGDFDVDWGDDSILWNYYTIIKARRKMPATSLRCTYKQIEITNAFTEVYRSDDFARGEAPPYGYARRDALDTGWVELVGDYWPIGVTGYFIAFGNDDYETQFEILEEVGGAPAVSLNIRDPLVVSPADYYPWHILGKKKDEGIYIESIAIDYQFLSNSTPTHRGESGANSDS